MQARKTIYIYTVIGILFGLCFPLGAWILDTIINELTFNFYTILLLHEINPLHYMIDSAPIFLGLFAMVGGISQYKAQIANQRLNDTLNTLQLEHENNQALYTQLNTEHQEMTTIFNTITDTSRDLSNNRIVLNQTMFHVSSQETQLQQIMSGVETDLNHINQYFKSLIDKADVDQIELESIINIMKKAIQFINEQHKLNDSLLNELSNNKITIENLNKNATAAKEIIKFINGISHQINLLSLNAAIEASRAGEAGRGFAIVADEIKSLSEQTDQATRNIESIIKQLTLSISVMDSNINSLQADSYHAITKSEEVSSSFKEVDLNLNKLLVSFRMLQKDMETLNHSIFDINFHLSSSKEVSIHLSKELKQSQESLNKNNEQLSILENIIANSSIQEHSLK